MIAELRNQSLQKQIEKVGKVNVLTQQQIAYQRALAEAYGNSEKRAEAARGAVSDLAQAQINYFRAVSEAYGKLSEAEKTTTSARRVI